MTEGQKGLVYGPAPFPSLPIRLSEGAELFLIRLGEALVKGDLEYGDLPPSLRALWTYAFEEGRRHSPTQQLRDEADRLYTELNNRPAAKPIDHISQKELQARRTQPYSKAVEPHRSTKPRASH